MPAYTLTNNGVLIPGKKKKRERDIYIYNDLFHIPPSRTHIIQHYNRTSRNTYSKSKNTFSYQVDSCFVPGGSHCRETLAPLGRTRPSQLPSRFDVFGNGLVAWEEFPSDVFSNGKA